MFGLIESEWGIIIIVAVVVLVFGGSQLPKLARSLGSAQSEFKKGLSEGKGDAAKGDAAKGDAAPNTAAPNTAASGDKAAAADGDGSTAASG